jgi:hypothetical protein
MIGRWSPSSSEEYIRTAKTTVLRLQAAVAKAIREAGQEDILGEAALADQLDAYLTERGIPSELNFEQLTSLMAWHRINVSPEEEGNPDTPEVIQTVEPPEEADTEGTEIPAGSWVISLSNTGKVMTLHLGRQLLAGSRRSLPTLQDNFHGSCCRGFTLEWRVHPRMPRMFSRVAYLRK